MKKKLAAVFLPLLLLLTVLAPAVQAAPSLPQYFYGTVTWGGVPAPAGTIIEAAVAGAINDGSNPISTTLVGQYGSADPLANVSRLLVQGDNITDGDTVTFYINGLPANQTAVYHAATVVNLDLTPDATYFHGNVLMNGSAAPAGTVISGTVTGAVNDGANPLTMTTIGLYGSADPWGAMQGLVVHGANITDNATISFFVSGATAAQTANYLHGDAVVQLDLTAGSGQTAIGSGNAGGGGLGAGSIVQVSGLVPSTPLFLDGSGRVLNTSILSGSSFAFTLLQGTRLVANNQPITNFSAIPLDPSVLPQPPNGSIILAYDFGPNGATFQPGISLTMNYDPATIPAGQKVKTIAYFDTVTNQWVQLQGTIDPATNSITVTVNHFTRFAIVTETESANFILSDMSMNQSTVTVGEKVTVTATLGNYGNIAGTQTVSLMVDGKSMIDQEITLEPGETTSVIFSVAMGTPGTYSIQIADMTSSLIVEAAPTPTTSPTTTTTTAQPTQTAVPTTTTAQPTQTTTAPTATATSQPTQTTTSIAPTTPAASSSGQNLTWIWILAGGVGAILVIGFITIAIRRRNS